MPVVSNVRSNTTRVLDLLEWHCNNISPDNGFISGPVVCNRSNDPRLQRQDQNQEFRQKLTRVTLKLADSRLLDSTKPGMRGTLGGVRRKWNRVEAIVAQALSKEQDAAGITSDVIQEWFRVDLEWGCLYRVDSSNRPTFLTAPVNDLAAKYPGWQVPSCINPRVTEVLHGPLLSGTNSVFVMRIEFLSDEYWPIYANANL